jgi:ADP-heptose:LPS heptosyltransferase
MVRYNQLEKEMHITDLFAYRLGLEGDFDKKPDYALSPFEKAWAAMKYPRIKKGRIGLQFRASDLLRTYYAPSFTQVVKKLIGRKWEVVFLGGRDEVPLPSNPAEGTINCTKDGLSFRESCAVLSTCDAFLGPDSSLIHVAGALGIPAVGLYGPFPWELRTKYAATTFGLSEKAACAPCHCHPRNFDEFPSDGPCLKSGHCTVLAAIEPDRIIGKLEQIARKAG